MLKSESVKHDSSNILTWKMVLAVVESFVVLDVAFVVKLIALKKEREKTYKKQSQLMWLSTIIQDMPSDRRRENNCQD